MTLYYDGHVGSADTRKAMRADGRLRQQLPAFPANVGLWSRDTAFGADGYYSDVRYETGCITSFHVLTTDGILGRDFIAD